MIPILFKLNHIRSRLIYPMKMNPPKIVYHIDILFIIPFLWYPMGLSHLLSHLLSHGWINNMMWYPISVMVDPTMGQPWQVNSSTAKFDGTDCATPTQIIAGIETPWGGPGWGWGWDFGWFLLIETVETRSKMIKDDQRWSKMIKVYLKLRFFLIFIRYR